jgi:hypothetical protein
MNKPISSHAIAPQITPANMIAIGVFNPRATTTACSTVSHTECDGAGEGKTEGVRVLPPGTNRMVVQWVGFQFESAPGAGDRRTKCCGKAVSSLVGVWPTARGHIRIDGSGTGPVTPSVHGLGRISRCALSAASAPASERRIADHHDACNVRPFHRGREIRIELNRVAPELAFDQMPATSSWCGSPAIS